MDKSKVNFSKPMLIQSVAFKEVFLRMDGKGISTACGAGAGKVNCQRSMAPTGDRWYIYYRIFKVSRSISPYGRKWHSRIRRIG